jgi:nitrogenase-stabilizing/protective protein
MAKQVPNLPPEDDAKRGIYRLWLERAYKDFVESDSITEKVFAVFQNQAKPDGGFSSFVSLDKVFRE